MTAKTEYYTMSDELAKAVAEVSNLSVQRVREYCLADWSEGQEHQDWLDNASVNEIAAWVLAGGPSAVDEEPEDPDDGSFDVDEYPDQTLDLDNELI